MGCMHARGIAAFVEQSQSPVTETADYVGMLDCNPLGVNEPAAHAILRFAVSFARRIISTKRVNR